MCTVWMCNAVLTNHLNPNPGGWSYYTRYENIIIYRKNVCLPESNRHTPSWPGSWNPGWASKYTVYLWWACRGPVIGLSHSISITETNRPYGSTLWFRTMIMIIMMMTTRKIKETLSQWFYILHFKKDVFWIVQFQGTWGRKRRGLLL